MFIDQQQPLRRKLFPPGLFGTIDPKKCVFTFLAFLFIETAETFTEFLFCLRLFFFLVYVLGQPIGLGKKLSLKKSKRGGNVPKKGENSCIRQYENRSPRICAG